uniref:Uncharacterized protein n=1 Tax=viral metagenome TaxID=1070528 RepID=A0A6M3LVJ7_9ZZZZ
MTPDEVVNKLPIQAVMDCLEACYLANEHPHPMGLALRQAISLLQDYQKLRERINAREIEAIIQGVCDSLGSPNESAQAIVTYLQQPTEPIAR